MFHQRDGAFPNLVRFKVRIAVDDVDGGVDPGKEFTDFGFHTSVPREADVDNRTIEAATKDSCVDHAGARGAGAMCDGSAIENNRFGFTGCETFEGSSFRDSDLEMIDTVIKWEVGRVLTITRSKAFDDRGTDFLGSWFGHHDPAPLPCFVTSVEIDATDASGWHVWHGQIVVEKFVVDPDIRRIRFKTDHHAGAVAAKIPDGVPDLCFSRSRETVKPTGTGFVFPGSAFDAPFGNIVPGKFRFCFLLGGGSGSKKEEGKC